MAKTICPECEQECGSRWVSARQVQPYCPDCGWKGEPHEPKKEAVRTTRWVDANRFSGYCYEIFDKRGSLRMSSRSYDLAKDARRDIQQSLNSYKDDDSVWPCKAILWPSVVKVRGEVIKWENQK